MSADPHADPPGRVAEHIVRVLTGGWCNGWCQSCDWMGPPRQSSREAGVDATRHAAEAVADTMRRVGE